MRKIPIFLLIFLLKFTTIYSQDKGTLSGFVSDASNGEALIGCSVFLKENSQLGSITNVSGYYVIPRIPSGEYTLVCDYIGYKQHQEKILIKGGEKQTVKISIEPQGVTTNEVEIVAEKEEVEVIEKLYKKPISKIELSPAEINSLPQIAEADLLRSLQTLPGVLPLSDFSSALYVRGGTPDQNLYMIDGTDVYNPEHAFGIFSTFNTDAIKKAELSKGGFGAEYGGRLSSILDVTNKDGNREEFEGSAGISLLSAKTTLQMPIGEFGSLSGSFRRTYFDQTVGRAIDKIPDYYFYDGNIKAFFDIDSKNKLTISGYGGRDFLDLNFNEDASDKTGISYDWGNKTGSIRWTRVFSPQLFGNFWVTWSKFSSDFEIEEIKVNERNVISDVTFKGNLEYYHSRQFKSKFGFEQKNLDGEYVQTFPEGLVDVRDTPTHTIGYATTTWTPTIYWNIETGLRYNFFSTKNKDFHNFDPRFSAKYRLTGDINLKFAYGSYHQYLQRIPRFFVADIWTTSNEFYPGSESNHYILGYQQDLTDGYEIEVETYYKDYKNILEFDQAFLPDLETNSYNENGDPIYDNTKGLFNQGDGNSMGFEVLLRKNEGAITGWIGYSLARTKNKFEDVNSGESYTPRHDRTQTINLVSNIDIKNLMRTFQGKPHKQHSGTWKMGVNFVYATGQPLTAPSSAYINPTVPDGNPELFMNPDKINSLRLPAYSRLDISLTYEKQFKTWSIAPYIQVFNIGNRGNVWFVDYEDNTQGLNVSQDIDEITMFPRLPTFGVNFKF